MNKSYMNKDDETYMNKDDETYMNKYEKNVKMLKGFNYIAMDELSKLQPGNYIIQFNTSTGKLIKQIVKQN